MALVAAACSSSATGSGDSGVSPDASADTAAQSTSTGDGSTDGSTDSPGSAAGFEITALPDSLAPLSTGFSKHVDVWGVHIVATDATDNASILHAANVMAQYLDNNADGEPDNPAVLSSMIDNRATLLMGANPEEIESLDQQAVFDFVGEGGQDLYASETNPPNGFDAALEEIHHLILNTGWSKVFPDQLAQEKGSTLAAAMDVARGGEFDSVPNVYPDGAWFTYDDETCDYTCMLSEYAYWAHTSLLGSQEGRADEIGREWRLETADKVRSGDPAVTAIFQDPALGLPTVAPDGAYTPNPVAGS